MRSRLLILLVLIAPFGIFFPFLGDFPFPPSSTYSDLAISHYPNAIYLLQSIKEWGQIPLWSNTILSGYPFAADPLSGLWYLPGWLAYLFPLPLGFNINIILHLFLGGAGTYAYLRKENKAELPSLAGGLTFELFTKFSAHYAAGHLTLIYAIAWIPWLFLCERHLKGAKRLLSTGAVLGMAALSDVRIFAFLFSAWLFFALYRWWVERLSNFRKFALRMLCSGGLSLLISAPLILPLIEYTNLTSRSGLSSSDNLAMALPLAYLAGLAIPNLRSYAEWVVYPGGVALIVTLFTLTVPELRKRNLFWLGMIFVAFLIALGPATPIGDWLFQLPGFNLLRVPSRVIFLTGWAFAMISADGIGFLAGIRSGEKHLKPPGNGLIIAAMSGFLLLLCLGLWIFTSTIPVQFLWGMIVVLITTACILIRRTGRLSDRIFFITLLPLILLDLAGIDSLNIAFRPASEVLADGSESIALIKQKAGDELFRVYSPSYSLPQQTAAQMQVELADGIDPMQLKSYITFMKLATGIPNSGYSVTLPPFSSAMPATDNTTYEPDPRLLGLLNVKFLVSAFNLDDEQLIYEGESGGVKIYENRAYRPRAWVQPDQNGSNPEISPVEKITWTPNKIDIETNQGGWLVLSENVYPGWKAFIDGSPAEIIPFASTLRSVKLSPGEHKVTFEFQPMTVYVGIFLGVCGWLIILTAFLVDRRLK